MPNCALALAVLNVQVTCILIAPCIMIWLHLHLCCICSVEDHPVPLRVYGYIVIVYSLCRSHTCGLKSSRTNLMVLRLTVSRICIVLLIKSFFSFDKVIYQ